MNVYILLDRSASMGAAGLYLEAIGSINGYVKKLDPDTNVHLSTFDDVSYDTIRETKVRDWKDLTAEEATPRGSTPLYDSAAKIMALAESDGAEKTILVVMTDGEENRSREVTQKEIQRRVASWEKRHWEVVFLGANFDAVVRVGASAGVRYGATVNYARGLMSTGMDMLASKSATYACAVAGSAPINFTEEERTTLAGDNTNTITGTTSTSMNPGGGSANHTGTVKIRGIKVHTNEGIGGGSSN